MTRHPHGERTRGPQDEDPQDYEGRLEALLTALAPGLLRYCRARTGDPELAEELAQDALAALVSRWRRGSPPDSPDAFVFTVARRRAGRWLTRRRWLAPLEAVLGPRTAEPDPERWTAERQRLRRVRATVARLPAADREVLLLAVAGDLDTATAAEALGISTSAFKMRLHRARRRLERLTETSVPSRRSLEIPDESIP